MEINNKEIWKPVVGYEGSYEVSNLGRVRSLDRKVKCRNNNYREIKGCVLVLRKNKRTGYQQIKLLKECKHKMCNVHRIVAEAFIPNPDNLPQINHKDENKLNNCVENLEFCTCKYNLEYSGNIQKGADSQKKPVIQLTLEGEFVAEYKSITDAAFKTKINQTVISNVCLGKRNKTGYKHKTAGGYKWIYK